MPKTTKKSSARKRTTVKQLPKAKQQLTGKSMKKVKGGIIAIRKTNTRQLKTSEMTVGEDFQREGSFKFSEQKITRVIQIFEGIVNTSTQQSRPRSCDQQSGAFGRGKLSAQIAGDQNFRTLDVALV